MTIIQEDKKIINRCKVNNDRNSIIRVLTPYAQMVPRLCWSQAGTGAFFTIC